MSSEKNTTKRLVVELTPEREAALRALADKRGLSPERWVQLAIDQAGRPTTVTPPADR